MKVYTLLFMDAMTGFQAIVLGNYSTPDLAIEGMKLYNEAMGYSPLEQVQDEVWGAEFSCEQGNYEIVCSDLDRMPTE